MSLGVPCELNSDRLARLALGLLWCTVVRRCRGLVGLVGPGGPHASVRGTAGTDALKADLDFLLFSAVQGPGATKKGETTN